jgi:hypothetical protein
METQKMLKKGKIAVLALTAVIAVALSLVLTCSAVVIPVMQPKLENATVDPGTTSTWDQSFTYAVNCIFYDTVSITLEVYNLSLHDWTAIGDRAYTGIGEWQSLTWDDVKICSGKCDGTSSYRFKYNGTILLTESGPTIAPPTPVLPPTLEVFKNATVKPAYGHYNDSFTYSIFTQSYTETGNWQLLSWANVTNVSAVDSAGVASYRFFFFDAGERRESEVFYGPELGLYPTPAPTVIYSGGGGGGGISWRRLLEDEKLRELADELKPIITQWEEFKTSQLNDSTNGPQEFLGPELNSAPVLSYPMVIPKKGTYRDLFVYKVNVTDDDGDDVVVTLHIVNSEGNWTNETHVISGIEAKRGKTERWVYNEFTKEASSKTFKYYFKATDGISPNVTTSTRIGPYINLGFIEKLSLLIKYHFYLFLGVLGTIIATSVFLRWSYKKFFKREIEGEKNW